MALKHRNYSPDLMYGAEHATAAVADGAITTAKIADSAVTTAKIAAANVTSNKLSSLVGYGAVTKNLAYSVAELSLFGTSGLAVATTLTGIFATKGDATTTTVNLVNGEASTAAVLLAGLFDSVSAVAGPTTPFVATAVPAGTNVFLVADVKGAGMATVTFEY